MQADSVDDPLAAVWKALANPTRRRLLDLLREGPMTTGALAKAFANLSRFAVMQHLRVLADAGLLVRRKSGRERYHYLNPVPIQRIYDRWVCRYQRAWSEALVDLKTELESGAESAPAQPHCPAGNSETA